MTVGLLIQGNVPKLVCLVTLHLVCNWSVYMIPCWSLQRLPGFGIRYTCLLMSILIDITAKIVGTHSMWLVLIMTLSYVKCHDENWTVNILNSCHPTILVFSNTIIWYNWLVRHRWYHLMTLIDDGKVLIIFTSCNICHCLHRGWGAVSVSLSLHAVIEAGHTLAWSNLNYNLIIPSHHLCNWSNNFLLQLGCLQIDQDLVHYSSWYLTARYEWWKQRQFISLAGDSVPRSHGLSLLHKGTN